METKDITTNTPCNSLTIWKKCEYLSAEEITSVIPLGQYCQVRRSRNWRIIEAANISHINSGDTSGKRTHEVTLRVANTNTGDEHYMNEMTHDRFILRLTNAYGDHYIIGTKDAPLTFAWSKEESDSDGVGASHLLSFKGEAQSSSMIEML